MKCDCDRCKKGRRHPETHRSWYRLTITSSDGTFMGRACLTCGHTVDERQKV